MLLSSGTAVALAGPAAAPTAPTPTALAAATTACNQATRSKVSTGKRVLSTALGSYSAQIYVTGRHANLCIYGTQGVLGPVTSTTVDHVTFHRRPGPDQLTVQQLSPAGSAPGFPGNRPGQEGMDQYVFGLVGNAVSAVTFKFAKGTTVDATVNDGWYFAWWPANGSPLLRPGPTSVRLTTATGTITSPLFGEGACQPGSRGCVWANQP